MVGLVTKQRITWLGLIAYESEQDQLPSSGDKWHNSYAENYFFCRKIDRRYDTQPHYKSLKLLYKK